MKDRIALLIGSAAVSCTLLASCGGGPRGTYMPPVATTPPSMPAPPPPPPPPPPTTMDLDTAAVLAIVQTKTSETADPFQVDGAAVAVTPVGDETSAPLSVDAK
jgi:hypothetical protein